MGLWKDRRNNYWKYQFEYQGKIYGSGGFKTRAKASAAREGRRKEVRRFLKFRPSSMSLSIAQNLYLDYPERRFVPKTYRYKKSVFQGFLDHVGDKEIDLIIPTEIDTYLLRRPTNHNFNVHRKELRAFFYYVIRKLKTLRDNPTLEIERMPEKRSIKYIPPQQDLLKVIMAAGPKERPLLMVILYTLARVDEILRLTWQDANFEHNFVRLWTRKRKNGSMESDDLPMNAELKEILRDLWKKRKQDTWVFYNEKTQSRYNRRPKFMPGLCRRARVTAFGFHALRHFSASYLYDREKVGKATLQKLLRHKSATTTDVYLHSNDEAQKLALARLEGMIPVAALAQKGRKRPRPAQRWILKSLNNKDF